MNYAIDSKQMREFDSRSSQIIPEILLMENAGRVVADHILRDLKQTQINSVVIWAGAGHNGGDGLVAARHLCRNRFRVKIFMCQANLKPLTITMLRAMDEIPVQVLDDSSCEEFIEMLGANPVSTVFVDAFLGSGINRPMSSDIDSSANNSFTRLPALIQAWNESDAIRYAIDVPSGSGGGPNWSVLKANYTLAVQFPRRFLYTEPLHSFCGEIRCLDIGFPQTILSEYCENPGQHGLYPLPEVKDLRNYIPKFPPSAHKSIRGRVEVFAGSRGMAGAALLSARAAIHSGAGMVRLTCADADLTDIVLRHEPSLMTGIDEKPGSWGNSILAGPGWGLRPVEELEPLFNSSLPLVLDADALCSLKVVYDSSAGITFKERAAPLILTPHPGEAAQLLNCPIKKVLHQPFESTMTVATRYHAWVILKSSITYISDPAGNIRIFDEKLPALGVAGSGDVLAGIVVALLARGLDTESATIAAVLLHAEAGRRCFTSQGWFSASGLIHTLSVLAGEIQNSLAE